MRVIASAKTPSESAAIRSRRRPAVSRLLGESHSLREERSHFAAPDQILHLFRGRCRSAAVGGVEDLREEVDVARRIEEESRAREHETHAQVDVLLVGEGLVPGRGSRGARARPWPESDRIVRLVPDYAFIATTDDTTR